MIKDIDKRIKRMLSGIRWAFRAVLGTTQSDSGIQLSSSEALAGEQLRDTEFFQHYGFTSNPLPGTEAIVIPLGGKTSHGIIVATENSQYRLKSLNPGEVALYTDEGAKVVLKKGRIIEVDCDVYKVNCKQFEVNATEDSKFNTPTVITSQQLISQGQITGNGGISVSGGKGAAITGNMQIAGAIKSDNDIVAGSVSVQKHLHLGDSGGQTSQPLT